MTPEFPLEFIASGTPVSGQSASRRSKDEWKQRIKDASSAILPEAHLATEAPMAVTLYYFPVEPMQGDIDNIVKPILDAMSPHVYLDDKQVVRLVVQKFETVRGNEFTQPSEVLRRALETARPVMYVRLSDDPLEELS